MLKPFNNQPQLISEPKVKPHCWRPYNSNNLYFGIKKTVTDKSTIFLVREKKNLKQLTDISLSEIIEVKAHFHNI